MVAYIQSCPDREAVLRETLADFAGTDWGAAPTVEVDDYPLPSPLLRQRKLARRILERAVRDRADFIVLLEDDLEFNIHLRTNLLSWYPLSNADPKNHFFAALFNPGVSFLRHVPGMAYAE